MPVYNAGDYLRSAIESVLAQSYQNWELIIVDDGSTDNCLAGVDDILDDRLRRVRQANSGKPAAMNRALDIAKGSFYALQDADDLSHSTRIALQVSCLIAHPDVAGVFCGHEVIMDGRILAPTHREKSATDCEIDIGLGNMPAHDPTAMYRLSLVGNIRYAEDLPIVEGHDYILRVGERFPLMVIGQCLYGYRVHACSVTKRDPSKRNRLAHEVLDRMRRRRGYPPGQDSTNMSNGGRRDADNDLVSHFTASVADQVNAGQRLGALRTGLASWSMNVTSLYYSKPFFYAFTPRILMKLYHGIKHRRQVQLLEEFSKLSSSEASLV